mmetsp:Transcript_69742/g.145744  ORF Transcript_69742/g.145744 Transcript_69742/m.145744 type:complete len:207 (-) Transcript_69742:305-925(-)
MVLGAQVALRPLAVLACSLVDVGAGHVATDEGDSPDGIIVAEEVHGVMTSMDHVQDSRRQAAVVGQLGQHHGGQRHALRGLHQEGVAGSHRRGEHPERDHGREVEGADASADAQRQTVGVHIHALGHTWQGLALDHRRHIARDFHDLQATEDVSLGISNGLSLLLGEHLRDGLCAVPNSTLELVHHPSASAGGSGSPGLVSFRTTV